MARELSVAHAGQRRWSEERAPADARSRWHTLGLDRLMPRYGSGMAIANLSQRPRIPCIQANSNRSPRLTSCSANICECGRKVPKLLTMAGPVFCRVSGMFTGIGTAGGPQRLAKRTAKGPRRDRHNQGPSSTEAGRGLRSDCDSSAALCVIQAPARRSRVEADGAAPWLYQIPPLSPEVRSELVCRPAVVTLTSSECESTEESRRTSAGRTTPRSALTSRFTGVWWTLGHEDRKAATVFSY